LPDLAPVLRKNRNVSVAISDPLGWTGILRMNHLFPPFNDVRARRAILMAINQEDYMQSFVGNDVTMWKPMAGFFTPGTPLYTEEGGEILKAPRDLNAAKRLLAESGYSGEPITLLAAQDLPPQKGWGDVTADLLMRLGAKVDYVAVDWGTVVARWVQKSPPRRGGWHMFVVDTAGAGCLDATNKWLRANGDRAFFGWPNIPEIEAEIAAWYDARTFDEEKAVVQRLNKSAVDHAVYAPLGFFLRYTAWRKNVSGIVQAPLPLFWGVSKTA
jgi:peptide/nickel transport system substrate-binding protein